MIDPDATRWSPGIGDPTLIGWLTVVAYLAIAIQCARNAVVARQIPRDALVWTAITLIMIFLGVNKQLDLQTWLTQTLRDAAMRGGWYQSRRPLQVAFIAVLVAASAVACWSALRMRSGAWSHYRIVACGMALLSAFVAIRAATFHHVDLLLGLGVSGFRVNHLLELGALALVSIGAASWNWNSVIFVRQPGRRNLA